MLAGIRIYTSDGVWQQIFSDLNATVLDTPFAADLNFDDVSVNGVLSPLRLKTLILSNIDSSDIIRKIFGSDVLLPRIQSQIVVALYKSKGLTSVQLKRALGYPNDVATHSIDTAIYQLRKNYGHSFIENDKGVYKLGGI